jgi:hypothetical protein
VRPNWDGPSGFVPGFFALHSLLELAQRIRVDFARRPNLVDLSLQFIASIRFASFQPFTACIKTA